MYYSNKTSNIIPLLRRLPHAAAVIIGAPDNNRINGTVKFYQTASGVLVTADIIGLPVSADKCKNEIFAFHIHSGTECSGNAADPYANAGTHYNPNNCNHPYHTGDMPPLFNADGRAFLSFLTNRFSVSEVIGKAIIVHSGADDFTSQPSGNAGSKIACGIINKVRR